MLTFDQLLEEYFFLRHLRPRSQTSYKSATAQLQKFMHNCGMTHPEELTSRDVFSWRRIALTQIREVSLNSYARHLRTLFGFGID